MSPSKAKQADHPPNAARKVLVVTSVKEHADKDRMAIKSSDLELGKICATGAQALQHLSAHPVHVIVLDTEIEDMDAKSFLRTVKNNPGMQAIPVVMCTVENDRNTVLDAVAAGCSGYIIRPYSIETFNNHIQTALQLVRFNEIEAGQLADAKLMMEMGDYDEAIEEFEEVVSMQGEAQKWYDLGCKYLVREKFGKAIVAFQKAIKINDLFAEAYQGLSEAYRLKGDMEQCQFFLKKAAEIYAEFDRMEKVKELFIDILKFDQTAANPFNTLGVRLRKNGDYLGAIRAYKQALELTPNDENIYYNMAKAYQFLDDMGNALKQVTMALRMNSDFPEARQLYKKLHGASWPQAAAAPAKGKAISGAIKDV